MLRSYVPLPRPNLANIFCLFETHHNINMDAFVLAAPVFDILVLRLQKNYGRYYITEDLVVISVAGVAAPLDKVF